MIVNLEHLGAEPVEFCLVLDQGASVGLYEEIKLCAPLEANLTGYSISDGTFRFEGTLKGTQLLTCSRSLETFEHEFETEVVFEVHKDQKLREVKLDDEDEELFVLRIPVLQESVSIDEVIRQLVVLQEPMNPVKDPEKDFSWRDTEPAEEAKLDPRWEKLKALKQKLESPSDLRKE